MKIQEIDTSACIHRLLALEGAIQCVKKTALSQECKADLKDFYDWNKGKKNDFQVIDKMGIYSRDYLYNNRRDILCIFIKQKF